MPLALGIGINETTRTRSAARIAWHLPASVVRRNDEAAKPAVMRRQRDLLE
jgi:hypothetical protein